MVADADAARELVVLGAEEQALLESVAAPDRAGAAASRARRWPPPVAPGAPELGVMLPYTPLHHLLLADFGAGALVMTSGNLSDEPIAYPRRRRAASGWRRSPTCS